MYLGWIELLDKQLGEKQAFQWSIIDVMARNSSMSISRLSLQQLRIEIPFFFQFVYLKFQFLQDTVDSKKTKIINKTAPISS
jgi:hypothetical protein